MSSRAASHGSASTTTRCYGRNPSSTTTKPRSYRPPRKRCTIFSNSSRRTPWKSACAKKRSSRSVRLCRLTQRLPDAGNRTDARAEFMRDVDIAQVPRDVARGAAEGVRGVAVRATVQQDTRRCEQCVHRAGMKRADTAVVGVLHLRAGVEQHGNERTKVRGIRYRARAPV